jgi:predicted ABC-type ATPase
LIKPKTKRLRIFAGPNGSGKSDLARSLENHANPKIKLGIFVNADNLESELKIKGYISLSEYHFSSNTKTLRDYIRNQGMSMLKLKSKDIDELFDIRNRKLTYSGSINSYIAADIAGFIREQLLTKGISFSFETVFSHKSKLEIMTQAKKLGYRIYFYFITTDSPEININRVEIREEKGGHSVSEKRIVDRYYKSLDLMYDAVKISNRAYLFDNSGKYYELVAEVTDGKKVTVTDYDKILPQWFVTYLYEKVSG